MTTPDFHRYLEQPRLLYDLPLADLQQLAMEYPYSPNLRLLLLFKASLDGHPEEEAYLNRAAAAAFDRAHVYDLLQELEAPQMSSEQEEMLELKNLDELALEDAALPAIDSNPQEETTELLYEDIFSSTINLSTEIIEDEEDVSISAIPTGVEEVPEVIYHDPEETLSVSPAIETEAWSAAATDFLDALPDWSEPVVREVTDAAPQPEPVTRFAPTTSSVVSAPLRERLQSIRKQQTEKIADEQEGVRRIARRSLVAQEAVASETLAQLLVRQGQYQNAIKMYRRLELLYPEKKTIFAGLIKDLKEKL